MPAHYIATMMASGDINWRSKFTSGLSNDGPDDKRLIIDFFGNIKSVPWITVASYGYVADLNVLVDNVPVLFDKKWIRGKGLRRATITSASENSFIIEIQI